MHQSRFLEPRHEPMVVTDLGPVCVFFSLCSASRHSTPHLTSPHLTSGRQAGRLRASSARERIMYKQGAAPGEPGASLHGCYEYTYTHSSSYQFPVRGQRPARQSSRSNQPEHILWSSDRDRSHPDPTRPDPSRPEAVNVDVGRGARDVLASSWVSGQVAGTYVVGSGRPRHLSHGGQGCCARIHSFPA